MSADVLTMPMVPDFLGHLELHFHRELAAVVHDWSRCTSLLTQWEDEHLLDHPTPEALARHKKAVERLLRFGRFLALAAEQPDFPDPQLADTVAATRNCLQDKLPLWHGQSLAEAQRAEILHSCFNES